MSSDHEPFDPTLDLGHAPARGLKTSTAGRFELGDELGRGGMGRVVEAWDPTLERTVAIKLPALDDEVLLRRFLTEARITARLQHPGIVPVHELGRNEDGTHFIAMKKVAGETLGEALAAREERDWPVARRLAALVQVCHAVAFAHEQGVVHRDLKPGNVMLGAHGEVLLMDWGVARVLGEHDESLPPLPGELAPRKTVTGASIGTPGYMSPEQVRGELEAVDGRSDVWSLGAMLVELVSGRPLFDVPDPAQRMLRTLDGIPELDLPEELRDIAVRALATDPDARPGAAELATALEDYLAGARRREAAAQQLGLAEAEWLGLDELRAELTRLRTHADELRAGVRFWDPLERKSAVVAADEAARDNEVAQAEGFARVVALAERALALDPDNADARAFLARVWFERQLRAEQSGDELEARFLAERVAAFDDGPLAKLRRGRGAVTLHTDPPGATVRCARFEQRGILWPLVDEQVLGTTPLVAVPLDMGSYLLTLELPGYRPVCYPVHITRSRHWESDGPIPLFTEEEIGPDFVYVPAGPFVAGAPDKENALEPGERSLPGFLIGKHPITMGVYLTFVNDLHQRDPDEAWKRSPRQEGGDKWDAGQYWKQPDAGGRYALPAPDEQGDYWLAEWPLFGVSPNDGDAFIAWLRQSAGKPVRWPTDLEREKAARGVDGRELPWGDVVDYAIYHNRRSRETDARVEPVGAFPLDVSVYGMADVAGCVTEFAADGDRFSLRGDSWWGGGRMAYIATRWHMPEYFLNSATGIRLACDLPER